MSNYYDDKIRVLREKVLRKRQLEAEVAELERQRREFAAQVEELDKIRIKENEDVERLENESFTVFIYRVLGKKDAMLDKERAEAYAAAVKYEAAAKELAEIDKELAARRNELGIVFDSEVRYKEVVAEKIAEIKSAGGETADEIIRREENILYFEKQIQELSAASAATVRARGTAGAVLLALESAERWGWLGDGLLGHEERQGSLDAARFMSEKLQSELRQVKTELADVKINAEVQLADGYMRFSDNIILDDSWTNLAVLDRIITSRSQAENTIKRLEQVQVRTDEMLANAKKALEEERRALDSLVNQTKI
ncbi:MAG: hypothetical protein IKT47_09210 [Oscillospiraceae bacterium]|nr:hypothetical protein [Oscillospiraceae bacterium]